jgi:hypothetical protein
MDDLTHAVSASTFSVVEGFIGIGQCDVYRWILTSYFGHAEAKACRGFPDSGISFRLAL